ncbi:MAG: hypothetical protein K0S27_1791, partial [Gammaproteobacteria bacterium]|nr:hypothetical protein [Gammaproteobacteria bacterium]
VAVTSGGYSLFKGVQHQRGQEQIKTELQKPHNVPDNQAPLSPSDKPK